MWRQFLLDSRVYGNIEKSNSKWYMNLLVRRLTSLLQVRTDSLASLWLISVCLSCVKGTAESKLRISSKHSNVGSWSALLCEEGLRHVTYICLLLVS